MLEAQAVNFLHLFPLGVTADGEHLEPALQRQHNGFGQAGVNDVGWQANALHALDLGGQLDFARFDHQHVGALGHFFGGQVQRTRHVSDDAAGLDLHDVQNLLACTRGAGHDHVHLAQQRVVVGRAHHIGLGCVYQDGGFQFLQLFHVAPGKHHLVKRHGQQTGADRADRARGTNDHGFGHHVFVHRMALDQAHAAHGVGCGPQRARGGVAVACGHGQGCAACHGDARIAHHLGECAQAHDLRAHVLRHFGRGQQPAVGEFGAARQHLFGRAAHADQPAFGFGSGGRDDVFHLAIHHGRHVGRHGFHLVHDELRCALRDREALADELLAQRVNHERKPADVAEFTGGVQQARLDVELVNDFQKVVVRHRFRWFAQGG